MAPVFKRCLVSWPEVQQLVAPLTKDRRWIPPGWPSSFEDLWMGNMGHTENRALLEKKENRRPNSGTELPAFDQSSVSLGPRFIPWVTAGVMCASSPRPPPLLQCALFCLSFHGAHSGHLLEDSISHWKLPHLEDCTQSTPQKAAACSQ